MHRFNFVCDNDGTMSNGFVPPPNGVGIEDAYRNALHELFGLAGSLLFDDVGGLQNRAPGELMIAILQRGNAFHLACEGMRFLDRHAGELEGFVPLGKGMPMKQGHASDEEVLTEALVRLKLRILCRQMTAEWPQCCPGIRDFLEAVARFNRECTEAQIDVSILSSGHTLFIERFFRNSGLPPVSGVIITDDELRTLQVEPHRKCKPDPLLLEQIYQEWFELCSKRDGVIVHRDMSFYAGDSLVKDGEMAYRGKRPFLWFNPGKLPSKGFPGTIASFDHWKRIADLLDSGLIREMMACGSKSDFITMSMANMLA